MSRKSLLEAGAKSHYNNVAKGANSPWKMKKIDSFSISLSHIARSLHVRLIKSMNLSYLIVVTLHVCHKW